MIEPADAERVATRAWAAMTASHLIYVAVVFNIPMGPPADMSPVLPVVAGGAAMALVGSSWLVRRRLAALDGPAEEAPRRALAAALVPLVMVEAVILIGLGVSLLGQRPTLILPFAVVSLTASLLHKPGLG